MVNTTLDCKFYMLPIIVAYVEDKQNIFEKYRNFLTLKITNLKYSTKD